MKPRNALTNSEKAREKTREYQQIKPSNNKVAPLIR